jgi:hypothetical protein
MVLSAKYNCNDQVKEKVIQDNGAKARSKATTTKTKK